MRASSALPIAKLTRRKLTPEAQGALLLRLEERGLQRFGKGVRVPLEAQILALVQGGSRLPLKDLGKRVKGAAKPELSAALDRLVRAGEARVIVRTQVEVLVGAGDKVLAPAEIAALAKLSIQVAKLLKKVGAKGVPRTLLREDLTSLLAPFVAAGRVPAAEGSRLRVIEALSRLADPVLQLVRIPALVRALVPDLPLAEVHRVLLAEADAGAIELRPEAGAEFLDPADAALCPAGPRGTVLSYARRLRS